MSVRRSLAIAVLASLLLSSCADDEPKPDIPSPTASAPTTSATTEPVDPLAYPTEAMEPTKAGAETLIRHFWDMVNHLRETGDSRPIRALYGEGCEFCQAGVNLYEKTLSSGGSYVGGDEHVLAIKGDLRDSVSQVPSYFGIATTATARQVEKNAAGEIVNRFPGGKRKKGYSLAFRSGRWELITILDLNPQ